LAQGNAFSTPVLGANGTVFAASATALTAITQDGVELWRLATGDNNSVSNPALTDDGIIYHAAGSMVLAVTSGMPPAEAPWPMYQHDVKHTARSEPEPQDGKLVSILPTHGGNAGRVTVTITTFGLDLLQRPVVRLARAGQSEIIASGIHAVGDDIVATFDLTGQDVGAWDVVVDASGQTASLINAFIIKARVADSWIEVLGPDRIRPGRKHRFTIVYGNRGDADAVAVPVVIEGIPAGATWNLENEPSEPPEVSGFSFDWSMVPIELEHEGLLSIPLLIPRIPARSTSVLPISIIVPVGHSSMELRATVGESLFDSEARTEDCLKALAELVVSSLQDLSPEVECLRSIVDYFGSLTDIAGSNRRYYSLVQGMVAGVSVVLNCAGVVFPQARLVKAVIDAIGNSLSFVRVIDKCTSTLVRAGTATVRVLIVTSVDPNEKVGPHGAGERHYLAADKPLPYTIFFENLEGASAPAQEIVVVDHVDTRLFDLNTLVFGPIVFGETSVVPSVAAKEVDTTVDLRPSRRLLVKVRASVDRASGAARWSLSSIDPATGEAPTDPLVGFLPPNVKPPQGTGSVMFWVNPLSDLATDVSMRNSASIVFDDNPPIATNVWVNTIDATPPVSLVHPLPPTQSASSFEVRWSGSDRGAGIATYSLEAAKDGGPFTEWLRHTDRLSGIFVGEPGSSYLFRSVARDRAGNIEAAHVGGDASTSVLPGVEGCEAGTGSLCLHHGRFRVDLGWKDFADNEGIGQVVPVSSGDSGLFWFFDPENWEMLVKMVDGCRLNQRYWVFSAASTTVEYTLRVIDTRSGVVKEYFNPRGRPAVAITDTDAFDTCPQ
jgi:hypothetical protein